MSLKSVEIAPPIQADPGLEPLVRRATEALERTVGPAASPWVSAKWSLDHDEKDRPLLSLRISDFTGSPPPAVFTPEELKNDWKMETRMLRLWGDMLQVRSYNQMASFAQEPSRLSGDDVIDIISNAIYDYTAKHGDQPHLLRIPIRYAVALMKLGIPFWGEFFKQIRESGVRAMDNQRLLGVPVKLVTGVDAEFGVE